MIALAKQEGSYVRVFDERNQQIFCRIGQLHGYTATTVAVKDNNGYITIWDDKGKWVSARHA